MPNILFQAACLGAVAGMRSMGAPALVSAHLSRDGHTPSPALMQSPLRWLASPSAALVFKFLGAGELVGDKLPQAPARTAPGPLFGRLLFGGLCGAALCLDSDESAFLGAILGAAGALASSFSCYFLRYGLTYNLGLPDFPVALAEDALAYGGGWKALSSGAK